MYDQAREHYQAEVFPGGFSSGLRLSGDFHQLSEWGLLIAEETEKATGVVFRPPPGGTAI
jgi:hypothetical protein